MYKVYKENWLKYYRFTIFDFLCMHIVFLIPIFGGVVTDRNVDAYIGLSLIMSLCFIVFILFNESYKDIYCRGHFIEVGSVLFQVSTIYVLAIFIMFILKMSSVYSRLYIGIMYVLTLALTYLVRELVKAYSKRYLKFNGKANKVVVFTVRDKLNKLGNIIECIHNNDCSVYDFDKVVILDEKEGLNAKLPNQLKKEAAFSYLKENVVDDVLIFANSFNSTIVEIEEICASMGIVVHYVIGERKSQYAIKEIVEDFGDFKVITSGLNVISARQMFLKRVIDICGSLVGLFLTGICLIFVAPIIFIKSPGPIFFAQTRMGTNGRKFKIYKFRSMYMDAEKRKAELMEKNKMNGLMFKMDDDPRIIKGIGHFIRASSIDELPQMWNVLKGDMSLVGTRPPTEDEFNQYSYHHKSRLAMKPGITGLWQISGRSDITDFEEVVELDNKYISEWHLRSDIKILFKTVLVVFNKYGAV